MEQDSLLLVLVATALVTAAAPAGAHHEARDCSPTAREPDLEIPEGGVFLVGQTPSVVVVGAYVYVETNGLDGLQRADDFGDDEDCGHGSDSYVYYWQAGVPPLGGEQHAGIGGLDGGLAS